MKYPKEEASRGINECRGVLAGIVNASLHCWLPVDDGSQKGVTLFKSFSEPYRRDLVVPRMVFFSCL